MMCPIEERLRSLALDHPDLDAGVVRWIIEQIRELRRQVKEMESR